MPISEAVFAPKYRASIVAVGIFVAGAALVLMGVQPLLVGLFSDRLRLSLSQNGWLLAVEQFGGGAGALLGYWLATRVRWTYGIASACVLAALINVATAFAATFYSLAELRFASGTTTTLAYTVAIYFLGQTRKPERVFGILMVLQTSFFSLDSVLLPIVDDRYGYRVAVGSAAAWFLAAAVAARWLPAGVGRSAESNIHTANSDAVPLLGLAALFGSFLLQLSIFSVWGFLERVGRESHLSEDQIGYAIGIGLLGGIPGGLLPSVLGTRFGRISIIAFSTVLLIASYFALDRHESFMAYLIWIGVLNVGWVLGLAYYMGLTVHHDPDGRMTRLMPFVQIFAAGVGPACSALVTSGDRLGPIFLVASLAAAAGVAGVAGVALFKGRLAA